MEHFPTIVGLAGVSVSLITYGLLASGRLSNDDWRYPVLNIVGTLGIGYSLLFEFNLPSMVTQLMWIAISLVGLMRIARNLRRKKGA